MDIFQNTYIFIMKILIFLKKDDKIKPCYVLENRIISKAKKKNIYIFVYGFTR